ncbi:MAG: sigma-54 dependent transcriptional regulator [Acidobacteriota bacterium]
MKSVREEAKIILVEDEDSNRETMARALRKTGYHVKDFSRSAEALDYLRKGENVFLVITDLIMPDMDGMDLLREIKKYNASIAVLMITGHARIESAVEAMKKGAEDYLQKPIDLFELRKRVGAIVEKKLLERKVEELKERLGEFTFENIIGKSTPMRDVFRQIKMVAPTRSSVLIIGESGTGKELIANAIHENSPRRGERFLALNCAAIPLEILESELFGHEKGSFTGAIGRKIGKFELTDRGTLFLDEVDSLPMEIQVKLLRALEEKEFMRVGGAETIKIDTRIIAATKIDLERMVADGTFREDLYYRLKVVTIKIPPLRERKEDIPLLVNHFLKKFSEENTRSEIVKVSSDVMLALMEHEWEGNVRELKNLIESLVVMTDKHEIGFEDLPEDYRRKGIKELEEMRMTKTIREVEKEAILKAVEKAGGNRTRAAEMLGMGLRTLYRKLREYEKEGRS